VEAGIAKSHHELRPERWVDEHADALFRYALRKVATHEIAEECVQETLVAALGARERFRGQASERTWLTAILKRKIADHYRTTMRQSDTLTEDAPENMCFRASGKWKPKPRGWHIDADIFEQEELRAALRLCLSRLPAHMQSAFLLRELHHIDSKTCSDSLGVTPTNLTTMVYRARLLLRYCMERTWFGSKKRQGRKK
jgi:RNA polymerase sigma-70 factor (ECF subfamily)